MQGRVAEQEQRTSFQLVLGCNVVTDTGSDHESCVFANYDQTLGKVSAGKSSTTLPFSSKVSKLMFMCIFCICLIALGVSNYYHLNMNN
jgi:hypothetical protein